MLASLNAFASPHKIPSLPVLPVAVEEKLLLVHKLPIIGHEQLTCQEEMWFHKLPAFDRMNPVNNCRLGLQRATEMMEKASDSKVR